MSDNPYLIINMDEVTPHGGDRFTVAIEIDMDLIDRMSKAVDGINDLGLDSASFNCPFCSIDEPGFWDDGDEDPLEDDGWFLVDWESIKDYRMAAFPLSWICVGASGDGVYWDAYPKYYDTRFETSWVALEELGDAVEQWRKDREKPNNES